MKFILALAFLSAVGAISRPEQISTSIERPELMASTDGSRQGNDKVRDAEGTAHLDMLLSELENSTESKNIEIYDYDEKVSLDDLIDALHRIRYAIQRIIHGNISHYKDSDDVIHVPFERVPVHEDNANETAADAAQQGNRTSATKAGNKDDHPQNKTVAPNNTKGNETASVHEPKINITQIKKEIHDKINNIIENIFRPWLGNNIIENVQNDNKTVVNNGNILNVSHPSAHNSSRPEKDGNGNKTATGGPQSGPVPKPPNKSASNESGGIENDTATKANNPEPPSKSASYGSEGNDVSIDLVEVNSTPDNIAERVLDNEISNIVPIENSQLSSSGVPRNVQANDESTSESKVRFVNPIRYGLYTRQSVQKPSLSYRNFLSHTAYH